MLFFKFTEIVGKKTIKQWGSLVVIIAIAIVAGMLPCRASVDLLGFTSGLVEGQVPKAPQQLGYTEACVLGLVQGVTEYLPISSTGHLIIATHCLGLHLTNSASSLLPLTEPATEGFPQRQDAQQALHAYLIVIQGGSILAIILLYPQPLLAMVRGLLGKDRVGLRLARNLACALVPSSILGLLLEKQVDRYVFNLPCVLIGLVAGAGVIFLLEKGKGRQKASRHLEGYQLSSLQCVFIGCLQVFSMWPGVSRSLMTLTGSYLVGLRPVQAAEFSFLLGFATLTLASLYKLASTGAQLQHFLSPSVMIIGVSVAFVASLICIKGLVGYLTRHSLKLFGWYRLMLALALSVWCIYK